MRRFLPHLIAGAIAMGSFASAGCVVRGAAHVRVAEPEMVYVGPNVWVVENHDEPVFYASDSYWLYRGGIWYRSSYYDRSWVRVGVHVVPGHVRRIDRPRQYVRYRAPANARRRGPVVRDHRDNRAKPATRDHRRNEPVKAQRPQPARPAHGQTRDHRKEKQVEEPESRDRRNPKKPKGNARDHRKN
ncbi:MAG TPA: hypothetical protein VML75_03120 [Kofleriaceae bacterium]|nr:hypothetical protein [Kofleriaceae bacterium]